MNRINQLFSFFFLTSSTGLIFNLVYASINNPEFQELVNFLNILTIYTVCIGFSFLLLAIILLDSSRNINTKDQILFIVIFCLICLILFLIPDGVNVPITSEGIQLSPQWSLLFSLTVILIVIITLALVWYFTIKLSKKFRNPILIRKLRYFGTGITLSYYIAISVAIANYLNTPLVRLFFMISNIIAIPSAILVYYGIILAPKVPLLD
ncbi:MAG: hypothetical protein ACTSR8_12780 [Promethearchaeota archaeon]